MFHVVQDEEHAIFSGDHVLGFGTTQLVDLYDYMSTLRRMKDYQPTRCYPGHGPAIGEAGDGGYAIEFLERYEAHRQSREDQVVQLLQRMAPNDSTSSPDGEELDIGEDLPIGAHGGRLDPAVWRRPSTLLIAQTLYQNTEGSKMQNACDNIEKIMIKLCLDGRAQCVDKDDDTPISVAKQRYNMQGGPLPENARWRWIRGRQATL